MVLALLGRKSSGQPCGWGIAWDPFGGYLEGADGDYRCRVKGLTQSYLFVLPWPIHIFSLLLLFLCVCVETAHSGRHLPSQLSKAHLTENPYFFFLWTANFHEQGIEGSYEHLFGHWGCQHEQDGSSQVVHGLDWSEGKGTHKNKNRIYAMTDTLMVPLKVTLWAKGKVPFTSVHTPYLNLLSLVWSSSYSFFLPHSTHLTNLYWVSALCSLLGLQLCWTLTPVWE